MPRSNQAFPHLLQMTHNPLQQIGFDPTSTVLGAQGNLTLPSLENLLVTAINELLQQIDNVTGLDFLGLAKALEALFTGAEDLLIALLDSIPILGPIIAVLTGTNPISSLIGATQQFTQFLLDIVSVIGNPLNLGTGNPVVNAIFSAIPILAPLVTELETTLINPIVGTLENIFPLITPFVIGAATTFTDLGQFLSTLVTQQQLQEIQDLLVNALSGFPEVGAILNSTKAELNSVAAELNATVNAASQQAEQALSAVTKLIDGSGLLTIPNFNISGAIGAFIAEAEGLGAQLQSMIDAGVQGLLTGQNLGNSAAQFQNAVTQAVTLLGFNAGGAQLGSTLVPMQLGGTSPVGSVAGVNTNTAAAISKIPSTAPPSWSTLLQGGAVTFPILQFMNQSQLSMQATITSTADLIGYITTPNGGVFKSIGWLGNATGATYSQPSLNITSLVINIYQVNAVTGNYILQCTSGNIIGQVLNSAAPAWQYWNIPQGSWINASPGSAYAVEMEVQGTGNYYVVGVPAGWLPTHPSAIPASYSATRNPTGNASPNTLAAPAQATTVPYFEMAQAYGANGSAVAIQSSSTPFIGSQTTGYAIPSWALYLDMVVIGAGGGGGSGTSGCVFATGQGGNAASGWSATTVTNIPGGGFPTGSLTVSIGAGGAGAPVGNSNPGGNGGGSSISGPGFSTLSAGGGAGGPGANNGPEAGGSPGNITWNGQTYVGGTGASSIFSGATAPGAGGFGSDGSNNGTGGTDGSAYIVARNT